MKKLRTKILYIIMAGSFLAPVFFIPGAPSIAAVGVTGHTSLVASQTVLPASSGELVLFQMNLSQDSGETLSSVSIIVNHNGTTTVAASHLASLAVYKDNGDGLFNPVTDLLAGSTTTISIDATTTIPIVANNTLDGGKFFVSLKTSALWTDAALGDSITVTFPASGITTSANSPLVAPLTTAAINADTTGPSLLSAVAQNTGGTAAKEAGDSVLLTFSEATNKPLINASNIASVFGLNNSHSFLDGAGQIQSAAWNVSGTALTITLSAGTSLPTVAVGDTTFIILPSVITDLVGNKASGSSLISGTFGGSITVVGPNSLITSPTLIGASSAPLGLFEVSLNQACGETLSSMTVTVNKNGSNNVIASDLASLAVYKDNGNGTFNAVSDLLAGSQSTVNINSPTTINTPSNNTLDGGKFFVALSTAASWSGNSPADSIIVTFPSNGIVLSVNSPTVTATTTSSISAPNTVGPVLNSAIAQNTGGTAAKEAGDSVLLTFSEPTNKPTINSSNIGSVFSLSSGHSFLDGAGQIGSAVWNGSGDQLTITLSAGTSLPTISVGDTVSVITPSIITDTSENGATGSAIIGGTFGNIVSVTTNPATNVTSISATLNGTNGASAADDTSFWVGTTSAGPFTPLADPTSELPSGWSGVDSGAQSANAAFSYPLGGLTPNTKYYFVAWSHVSGIWYPDTILNFTTQAAANNPGTISGMTYNDLNKNEAKDPGEPGIAGFTIKLYNVPGWSGPSDIAPIKTAVTDSGGNYSFSNLPDGTYSVEEVNLPAWHQDTGDYSPVVISNGVAVSNIDFANTAKNGGEEEKGNCGNSFQNFFGNITGRINGLMHGNGNKFGLLKHGLLNSNVESSDTKCNCKGNKDKNN